MKQASKEMISCFSIGHLLYIWVRFKTAVLVAAD